MNSVHSGKLEALTDPHGALIAALGREVSANWVLTNTVGVVGGTEDGVAVSDVSVHLRAMGKCGRNSPGGLGGVVVAEDELASLALDAVGANDNVCLESLAVDLDGGAALVLVCIRLVSSAPRARVGRQTHGS